MKLLHTADWHIGRTLNGYSLLAEQKSAFKQILELAKEQKVDGIIIAGDLYDRAVPPTDAVTAFDGMMKELNLEEKFPIYAISGNHDGAKRLNYGRNWMEFSQFHLNTLLAEAFTPIETDGAQIYLLPYFDPIDARVFFSHTGMDEEEAKKIRTIGDAMNLVIEKLVQTFDPRKKHILVTHFSVSPKADMEIELTSETPSKVGGLNTLVADQFKDFDYVALGHIHTHNASPAKNMKYSGSPVKFNVKEARMKNGAKGVYIIDIDNDIKTEFYEIKPETDLVVLEEECTTLTNPEFYQTQPRDKAWFAITIKNFDRGELTGKNIRSDLQKIYGTVVELNYDEQAKKVVRLDRHDSNQETQSNEEIVSDFYKSVTGNSLTDEQNELIEQIFIELGKED